jgi:hypothetical protein
MCSLSITGKSAGSRQASSIVVPVVPDSQDLFIWFVPSRQARVPDEGLSVPSCFARVCSACSRSRPSTVQSIHIHSKLSNVQRRERQKQTEKRARVIFYGMIPRAPGSSWNLSTGDGISTTVNKDVEDYRHSTIGPGTAIPSRLPRSPSFIHQLDGGGKFDEEAHAHD